MGYVTQAGHRLLSAATRGLQGILGHHTPSKEPFIRDLFRVVDSETGGKKGQEVTSPPGVKSQGHMGFESGGPVFECCFSHSLSLAGDFGFTI